MILTAKKHKKAAAVVLTGAVTLGGTIGYTISKSSNKADSAQASVDDVRNSQVAVCQQSLEPGGLRYIVADGIRRELQRSKLFTSRPEAVAAAFGISEKQARIALAQSDADQRRELRDLLDVNCPALYPKP